MCHREVFLIDKAIKTLYVVSVPQVEILFLKQYRSLLCGNNSHDFRLSVLYCYGVKARRGRWEMTGATGQRQCIHGYTLGSGIYSNPRKTTLKADDPNHNNQALKYAYQGGRLGNGSEGLGGNLRTLVEGNWHLWRD